jgi:hypothetical protein
VKDLECQVCHRLEFGNSPFCMECKWPLKPVDLGEPVYGFDLAVQMRVGAVLTEVVTKHYKTASEKSARAKAKANVRNFSAVLAVRPLSERQYIAAYGEGRM